MKDFFKFTFASCLGVFLALLLLSFIGTCALGKVVASTDKSPKVSANSILEIKLDQPIPEKTNNINQPGYTDGFEDKSILGLHDIVKTIEYAKEDKNIKGIYLNLLMGPGGFATSAKIRSAIEDFKSEGKFVVAYSKLMTQGAYHIATAADEIHMNPLGFLDFRGFSSTRTFYKGMLDKLDARMEVYYAGQFKSATEPYRLKKMSAQNKYQVRTYLNELYGYFIDDIAKARDIAPDALRQYADDFIGMNIEEVHAKGMIDELSYETDVIESIKERVGIQSDKKLKMVSLESYHKAKGSVTDYSVKDKIAVVYAEGTIIGGKGQNGSTGGQKYVEIIEKLRKDDKIKAIVLRVNSGGGDAIASDKIWHELEKVKSDGKPVVVSFGDVAASGGYYIACGADKIYADQRSITGSIGVFRLFPVIQNTLENKLGITHDTVSTGSLSAGLNPVFEPSEKEKRIMQAGTEQMYQTFLQRVADGRNMTKEAVHEIAQGRVWTAPAALNNGLVDEIGSLSDAVAFAAEEANLQKWRIVEYPRVKTPWQELLDDLMNPSGGLAEYQARKILGDQYEIFKDLEEIMKADGYQARVTETLDFK